MTNAKRAVLLSTCIVSVFVLQCRAGEGGAPPNVLFVLSDDHRADAIGSQGQPWVKTPKMDRLADEGLTMSQLYNMGSYSGAVCVASRSMILTGRSLWRARGEGHFHAVADVPTMPEVFQDAGYETFIAGKWHNERKVLEKGFSSGSGVFVGPMGNPYEISLEQWADGEWSDMPQERRHLTERITDEAVAFLQRRKTTVPFFAYVAYTMPHDPRVPEEPYRGLYEAHDLPLPPAFLPEPPVDTGELAVRDEYLMPKPLQPDAIREELALYYGEISALDHALGRLIAALKASGQWEHTIIVYASDHGLALGSHGLLGKQSLYEHSLRSPFIMAGPGIPAGVRSARLAYLYDVFPTLLELVGLSPPATVDGRSFAVGTEAPERTRLHFAYKDFRRAIRSGRFKLTCYLPENEIVWQLFDLERDPHEEHNLIGQNAYAPVVRRLIPMLRTAMEEADDPHLEQIELVGPTLN